MTEKEHRTLKARLHAALDALETCKRLVRSDRPVDLCRSQLAAEAAVGALDSVIRDLYR